MLHSLAKTLNNCVASHSMISRTVCCTDLTLSISYFDVIHWWRQLWKYGLKMIASEQRCPHIFLTHSWALPRSFIFWPFLSLRHYCYACSIVWNLELYATLPSASAYLICENILHYGALRIYMWLSWEYLCVLWCFFLLDFFGGPTTRLSNESHMDAFSQLWISGLSLTCFLASSP